jgi:hypothetical protein
VVPVFVRNIRAGLQLTLRATVHFNTFSVATASADAPLYDATSDLATLRSLQDLTFDSVLAVGTNGLAKSSPTHTVSRALVARQLPASGISPACRTPSGVTLTGTAAHP